MGITTKLNRPNKESEHAAETRDYRTNGGRHAGNSRLTSAASGGYPYTSPHYQEALRAQEAGQRYSPNEGAQDGAESDTEVNPIIPTGAASEGIGGSEAPHGETPTDAG